MYIDTTSIENMKKSMATLLGISLFELDRITLKSYAHSMENEKTFNQQVFNEEMSSTFRTLLCNKAIDEILFFHLTYRPLDSLDFATYNLQYMLLNETILSSFLKEYDITFCQSDSGIDILHKNKPIDFDRNLSIHNRSSYLHRRLGHYSNHLDYCVNGFALRYSLLNNSYVLHLYEGPEFLINLSCHLHIKNMLQEFRKRNKYLCLQYKLPFDTVIIDGCKSNDKQEKNIFLLTRIAWRIASDCHRPLMTNDEDNPYLYLPEQEMIPSAKLVNAEEIIDGGRIFIPL